MSKECLSEETINLHRAFRGKIEVSSKVPINTGTDLSLVYTPGVADICKAIADNPDEADELTSKGNMVAIVTDGTAVLGLGDIGPKAALPVMEGKSLLFKKFAGIDAFPLCLDTQNTEEIISTIKALAPTFSGVNLEDISAPRCFEIEERLKEELDIPVFHDDQHGTAIVVLAALINALQIVNKTKQQTKVVINGAGAAGIAIADLLLYAGFTNVTLVSLEGIVRKGAPWMNARQASMAEKTNLNGVHGGLNEVIEGADIFIGVSAPGVLSKEQVKMMKSDAIIFALANPIPEIYPEDALEAGAVVVGTGRSDYPNQINNLLAFPGIFKGALDHRVRDITMDMKVAAAEGIAKVVSNEELCPEYVIPSALNQTVALAVADAVGQTISEKEVCVV
ncbi:NAD-dependent malic enzyme [Halobacillus karajensis]|uniref:NADP-dependent malic enzyme n=1 Tax=Halobacillus karajensis TaxID=195088 RepID=A0A024P8S0_9BACI|nr:NADP-dependent malic enzyme [Halobacillus karajensis]CDQ20206.1 NADP-dependent malic enzyme [Halobacillus karajensis]CDQ25131.1 NADP-dependent malic enzyme [Halobacillus karajensis]CDQ28508.1 NADP-dependent malic enzyme [Halobacillus karajensis]SEI01947.1 NAD-dependent malic enzyme [Halobacillus karajensis]